MITIPAYLVALRRPAGQTSSTGLAGMEKPVVRLACTSNLASQPFLTKLFGLERRASLFGSKVLIVS